MAQVFGETSKKPQLLCIWLRGILQDHILRQRDQHKEGHKKCLGTRLPGTFLISFCIGCRICRVWRVYDYHDLVWLDDSVLRWSAIWLAGRTWILEVQQAQWIENGAAPRLSMVEQNIRSIPNMRNVTHAVHKTHILYPYQRSYIDRLDRQTKKQAHWMRWTLYNTSIREIAYARDRCVCPYEYMRNDKIRCERSVRTLKRTMDNPACSVDCIGSRRQRQCFDCFCQWIGRQILAETWHTWRIHTYINTYIHYIHYIHPYIHTSIYTSIHPSIHTYIHT